MRTNVYVDGFNLYFGVLERDPGCKWLDIGKLCRNLLPGHEINRIRYFTALVHGRPNDPQQRQRQQTFIRALETIPSLTVHYGHFLSSTKRMPLAQPPPGGPRTVEVLKTEEKGSDVNLASYLLIDGFHKEYELAAVVSNDSDLKLPIEIVIAELRLEVCVLNPLPTTSWALKNAATSYRPIRARALRASQFPEELEDEGGAFRKPERWSTD